MALPWLQIVDAVLGVANFARGRAARGEARAQGLLGGGAASGRLETRVAGVMVAALKEVFDRDSRRLEFEREQADLQRQRAERALALELLRQAGDREMGRLRVVAAIAVAAWMGTLFALARNGAVLSRVTLGGGMALLLAALACALAGQSRVSAGLGRIDAAVPSWDRDRVSSGTAGASAPWLLVAGLVVSSVAVLMT